MSVHAKTPPGCGTANLSTRRGVWVGLGIGVLSVFFALAYFVARQAAREVQPVLAGEQSHLATTGAPPAPPVQHKRGQQEHVQFKVTVPEAVATARDRGCSLFLPRYWPKSLPKPVITAVVPLPADAIRTQRAAISVWARAEIPPKERSPKLKWPGNAWRTLTISLYPADRVPAGEKLDCSRQRTAAPSPPPARDPFHGNRVTYRPTHIAIGERDGCIFRQGLFPDIILGWRDGDTYILINAGGPSEEEVLRVARSLRRVSAAPGASRPMLGP
jgi:hypothetical protein